MKLKSYLIILLLLIAFALPCEARMGVLLGAGVSGAACDTGGVSCTGVSDGEYYPGRYINDNKYEAARFTTTSTSAVCKITASLKKTVGGNPDYNIRACIYSNNAATTPETPDALVGSCSGWVAEASVTTDYSDITFLNIATGALLDATLYWVVIEASENADNTYYYSWARVDGCATEVIAKSGDGSTWVNVSEYRSMIFQVFH